MNKEQKKYTVQKIEKYNEEIDKKEKDIKHLLIANAALAVLIGSFIIPKNDLLNIIATGTVPGLFLGMKIMVDSICNKAGLKNSVANLEHKVETSGMEFHEQKRYTVEKIEKYNEEIDQEKKNIKEELIKSAGIAFSITCCIIPKVEWVQYIAVANAPILVWGIRNIVDGICSKAGLENSVSDFDHQVEMLDRENNYKGRGR